jgi:microcystin-dependent protein
MNPLRNILNDTPVNAIDVDWNFQAIEDYTATDLVHRDGSVAMEAPLSLLGTPPTLPAHAAPKSYVDALLPVGMMMAFGGPVAPAGWALCDGAQKNKTDPAFVALFNTIGYAFGGSGDLFNLPDTRGRVAVGFLGGDASFGVMGAKNAMTARDATLPTHSHVVNNHNHSGATTVVDTNHLHDLQNHQHYVQHSHDSNVRRGYDIAHANIPAGQGVGGAWARTNTTWQSGGAPLEFSLRETAVLNDTLPGGGHQQTTNANRDNTDGPSINNTGWMDRTNVHSHGVYGEAPGTNNAGVAATNANLPPYIVVNHIIRIG